MITNPVLAVWWEAFLLQEDDPEGATVGLHALYRAAGSPAGADPATWLVRADPAPDVRPGPEGEVTVGMAAGAAYARAIDPGFRADFLLRHQVRLDQAGRLRARIEGFAVGGVPYPSAN